MVRLAVQKTSFTAGEISPRLLGRGDLRAYQNGAGSLRNVVVHPTGGISRRPGLRHVAMAAGSGRLVSFEFNTEQVYLLAFADQRVDVYRDDVWMAQIATPWTADQIAQITWVQSADTLFVAHPDVPTAKITRTSHVDWTIEDLAYYDEQKPAEGGEPARDRVQQPHHKFAKPEVTLQASATGGSVTLTASAAHFVAGHVGKRFRLENREVEVTAVSSATSATASVKETLKGTAATKDWEEAAFNELHGWPTAICFHQDRLVIGGSRDLPNRLWLSKSADLFNFDLGEGLDDEAIEFAILSDQVNAIRAVFSGRHLQVFTSGAEWMVTGDPLTPENVQLNRQTRIGSPVDRTVPPRDVDGATLFVPRNGPELREFLFTDVEQAYQASYLATLAQHLVDRPVDQDYDTAGRRLHLVMTNGTLATVTIYRAEEVTAWTLQETDGAFRSVAHVGDLTYVLVERNGATRIERFDDTLYVDAGVRADAGAPQATWPGFGHLEGRTLRVLADGAVRADATVAGGVLTVDPPAVDLQAGLALTHKVAPLPPAFQNGQRGGMQTRIRPVSLTFRLQETAALELDTGQGLREVPFKSFGAAVLDAPPTPFTGDKTVRARGWRPMRPAPLWHIEQSTPLPFTLLAVSTEVSANL